MSKTMQTLDDNTPDPIVNKGKPNPEVSDVDRLRELCIDVLYIGIDHSFDKFDKQYGHIKDWVAAHDKAVADEARIGEENIHLDKLKSGKWVSYGTEVTNRLAALKAGEL